MFRRISLIAFFFLFLNPAFSQNFSHLKAELLCEQTCVQPGGSVTVAVHFRMQKGWHVYWQNPGDSGQAPSITWTLPEGFTAGEIQWPVPQRLVASTLADYGYTNDAVLLVPLQAPPNLKPGHIVRLSARVHWLVCQEICIPGSAQMNLRLPIRKKPSPYNSRYASLFKGARRSMPLPLPDDWKAEASVGAKEFHLSFDTGAPVSKTTTALFFPLHPSQIENGAKQACVLSENSIQLSLKKSDQLSADVKTLEGILVVEQKTAGKKGYIVTIPLGSN